MLKKIPPQIALSNMVRLKEEEGEKIVQAIQKGDLAEIQRILNGPRAKFHILVPPFLGGGGKSLYIADRMAESGQLEMLEYLHTILEKLNEKKFPNDNILYEACASHNREGGKKIIEWAYKNKIYERTRAFTLKHLEAALNINVRVNDTTEDAYGFIPAHYAKAYGWITEFDPTEVVTTPKLKGMQTAWVLAILMHPDSLVNNIISPATSPISLFAAPKDGIFVGVTFIFLLTVYCIRTNNKNQLEAFLKHNSQTKLSFEKKALTILLQNICKYKSWEVFEALYSYIRNDYLDLNILGATQSTFGWEMAYNKQIKVMKEILKDHPQKVDLKGHSFIPLVWILANQGEWDLLKELQHVNYYINSDMDPNQGVNFDEMIALEDGQTAKSLMQMLEQYGQKELSDALQANLTFYDVIKRGGHSPAERLYLDKCWKENDEVRVAIQKDDLERIGKFMEKGKGSILNPYKPLVEMEGGKFKPLYFLDYIAKYGNAEALKKFYSPEFPSNNLLYYACKNKNHQTKFEMIEWMYANRIYEHRKGLTENHYLGALRRGQDPNNQEEDPYGFTPYHYSLVCRMDFKDEKEFDQFLLSLDVNLAWILAKFSYSDWESDEPFAWKLVFLHKTNLLKTIIEKTEQRLDLMEYQTTFAWMLADQGEFEFLTSMFKGGFLDKVNFYKVVHLDQYQANYPGKNLIQILNQHEQNELIALFKKESAKTQQLSFKENLENLFASSTLSLKVTQDKNNFTLFFKGSDKQIEELNKLLKLHHYSYSKGEGRKNATLTLVNKETTLTTLFFNNTKFSTSLKKLISDNPKVTQPPASSTTSVLLLSGIRPKQVIKLAEKERKNWEDVLRMIFCYAEGMTIRYHMEESSFYVTLPLNELTIRKKGESHQHRETFAPKTTMPHRALYECLKSRFDSAKVELDENTKTFKLSPYEIACSDEVAHSLHNNVYAHIKNNYELIHRMGVQKDPKTILPTLFNINTQLSQDIIIAPSEHNLADAIKLHLVRIAEIKNLGKFFSDLSYPIKEKNKLIFEVNLTGKLYAGTTDGQLPSYFVYTAMEESIKEINKDLMKVYLDKEKVRIVIQLNSLKVNSNNNNVAPALRMFEDPELFNQLQDSFSKRIASNVIKSSELPWEYFVPATRVKKPEELITKLKYGAKLFMYESFGNKRNLFQFHVEQVSQLNTAIERADESRSQLYYYAQLMHLFRGVKIFANSSSSLHDVFYDCRNLIRHSYIKADFPKLLKLLRNLFQTVKDLNDSIDTDEIKEYEQKISDIISKLKKYCEKYREQIANKLLRFGNEEEKRKTIDAYQLLVENLLKASLSKEEEKWRMDAILILLSLQAEAGEEKFLKVYRELGHGSFDEDHQMLIARAYDLVKNLLPAFSMNEDIAANFTSRFVRFG